MSSKKPAPAAVKSKKSAAAAVTSKKSVAASIASKESAAVAAVTSKKSVAIAVITSSPETAPKLQPYDYKCRGPFNFLRHRDTPVQIPEDKSKGPKAAPDSTDKFAETLLKDPFMDFEFWQHEYDQKLSLNDFKDMQEIIWKQEAEMASGSIGSASSDTHRTTSTKTPGKTVEKTVGKTAEKTVGKTSANAPPGIAKKTSTKL